MHSRFSRLNVVPMLGENSLTSAFSPTSARLELMPDDAMPIKSCEKVFCRLMQNLYSSIGTTPMREQAKKPFKMFSAVVLMFALPH